MAWKERNVKRISPDIETLETKEDISSRISPFMSFKEELTEPVLKKKRVTNESHASEHKEKATTSNVQDSLFILSESADDNDKDETKEWEYAGGETSNKGKERMMLSHQLKMFKGLTVHVDKERMRKPLFRQRDSHKYLQPAHKKAKYQTEVWEYKGRTTSRKSKESMASHRHKLKILPTRAVDDDLVCKERLESSSTACIIDKIDYLNCEGLTSHRLTNVSQVNCTKNVKCSRVSTPLYRRQLYGYEFLHLSEIVKLFCNTFKTMILENKTKEKVSSCFGYKLRLELYDEIRKIPEFWSERILLRSFYGKTLFFRDIFRILYSMKHIYSIPIYELLRKGGHLSNCVSRFHVPKEAMDITLQGIKRGLLLQRENRQVYIRKLLFCQYESKLSNVYLLVYYKGEKSGLTLQINGIDVKWKKDAFVNNEAKLVMEQRPCFGRILPPNSLPRVTTEVASQLFKQHSNLTMISVSEFKSTGYIRKDHTIKKVMCYQLFCKSKGFIPLGEPLFPTKIDSFDVDVLEGICYFGNDCVQMGTEIGAEGQCKTGAIGGFVDLPQNRTGLITCAHNLYFPRNLINGNIETDLKVYIEKCSKSKLFDESGHILKSVFRHGNHRQVSVDAALIQIDKPISASFPDVPSIQIRRAGFDPHRPPQFYSGEIVKIPNRNQRVIKYGPVSELTCGTLCLDGLHVRMEKEEMALVLPNNRENDSFSVIMYGQYGVNNTNEGLFFLPGDSGSFVFTVEEDSNTRQTLKCVGMAIGIAKGPGTCIVTPIKDVLEALGLDMRLKKFSNHNGHKDNQSNNSQSLTTDEMFKMLISSNQNLESKLDAQLKKSRDEMKNEMQNFKTEVNDSLNTIKEELSDLKGENAKK